MSQEYGSWTVEDSLEVYHNDFFQVVEDQVIQPDGKPGHYSTVSLKPGVAILALDMENFVYLVKQFRYAIGRESVEVMSGGIEKNEPPLDSAVRELREEAGIEAGEWEEMGIIDLDTSIVECPVHLFIARHLTFHKPQREGSEVQMLQKIHLKDATDMVMQGTITHSPSCVLILKAALG